jgi:signal transduction histidine kinase/CheY-like chemotaxis protein
MTKHRPAEQGHQGPFPPRHGWTAERSATAKLWILIMLAELAIVMAATPFAIQLADARRYGAAATVLISSTLIAGSLVFVLWRKQHLARVQRLAEQKRSAERKRKDAEAETRQKSRQLATMSHEIRTPLNGVIGMLGLLLETGLTAEQKNYAGIAHGSARSLLSFLDEILDTAKGEAAAEGRDKAFELVPFIEAITELMAPRAHAKGIDLSALIATDLPPSLRVDQQKLRQILFNLVGNAIKFTESGGVEVLVGRNGGSGLSIEIRDTGIGMTPEELARLFADYSQANEETSRRYGGTGLGLAISKGLAAALGGTLTVRSRKGEGTSFTVLFPQVLEDSAPTQGKPLAGRSFGMVMVESIAQRHLQSCLEALGASVAQLSEDALAALTQPIAGLIADVSTVKAVAEMRRGSRKLSNIPLWILLAPEERRGVSDILRMPNTGYLVKPLRFSSLVTRLTERDQGLAAAAVEGLRKLKPPPRRIAKLKVLLVDDTPVNLLLARTLLARNGHEVTTAMSGVGMISLIERGETFDCVLLDIEMPGLDGYETARKLRELEVERNWPRTPVIALTANTAAEDKAQCLSSGMDGYLAKPFDQHDLLEVLGKIAHLRAA